MPNAKDVHVEETDIRVFVAGDSGTGKSVFAATFPGPKFLFNFDKGVLSYRGTDTTFENYPATALGWVKFEKDFRKLKEDFKKNPEIYRTVIVDSTTSWTDLAMARAMQLDPKRSVINGPLWNVHYGIVRNLIEGYIRQILELPCNIVTVGHLDIVIDNDTGAIIAIQPLLTGQLSTKLPAYFDEVYYAQNRTKQGKTAFVLLTLAKGFYKARSRISGVEQLLPAEIPNNYEEIMKRIKGKK